MQALTQKKTVVAVFVTEARMERDCIRLYARTHPEVRAAAVLSGGQELLQHLRCGLTPQVLVLDVLLTEKSLFCEEPEDRTVENARNISKFQNVFKLIRSRYRDPLTLEDMAAEANMSPNYFCQVFKEITHYSPVEYLMHYRIEYSKHLLCVKHATVSEAAFLSGFNSPAYYIKVFKDLTGSTPNRYKKSFAVHS